MVDDMRYSHLDKGVTKLKLCKGVNKPSARMTEMYQLCPRQHLLQGMAVLVSVLRVLAWLCTESLLLVRA